MRDKYKVLDSYQHDYTYFEEIRPEDTMLQVPLGKIVSFMGFYCYSIALIPISILSLLLGIDCESARLSEHEPIDPLMEFTNPSIEHTRVNKAFHK